MPAYSALQTRVERRVIDLPSAVQAEVPDLINDAMRELQTRRNFRVMKAQASYTTTDATRILGAIPTDFKEWRGKPWLTDDDTGNRHLVQLAPSEDEISRLYGEDDEGRPRWLLEETISTDATGNLQVWPLPDGLSDYDDGEYRVTLPYWKFLADLSADADENWFTTWGPRYLIFKATGDAFMLDWDEERAGAWYTLAEGEFQKVTLLDKRQQVAQLETLVPYMDAFEPHVDG